ncbi:3-hydroxyacyl-CoA dehydrogenase/enoyl-CoA hydratase family protein [Corynebacterium mastitidis]|uniref:enoyl-CoA hydratase n=1 Tax=Corynebacterium mastitidis TaxID=161890 RepID=A0A2N0X609_9CORY|nr:3-hydroxyacyl-CoA dehydrogenase/enoyl-CoA hydratase family protein [Corynebacterium mastitidis]MCH6196874.1 3-hydroxyacyl-CoA dehydrogenase/enoyl-CoA hydratase family protein [Corynebacterium mastitidis]PKF68127.1 3-hydroxyacyl-CoA dehydrogenase [Corynebacterium mastitidis]
MSATHTTAGPIRTAAVFGAGSMGAGIAAHLANAGVRVHLLDIPAEGEDRDARAKKGIELQLKRRGFMRPEYAENVIPGNVEDHLDRLGEAEWIVEAVFEDLKVKQDTFRRIDAHRAPGTPVSSNTSTIPLADLLGGLDEGFRRDFAITHFFNPPRVMRLVELVAGPDTRPEVIDSLTQVLERQMGKVIVDCRDTPGFIANRIGNFWMAAGAHLAFEQGIAPEQADAAFGRAFGIPRTGIFGLFDYVGLQLVPAIWGSLLSALPDTDAYHRFDITRRPEFTTLLDKGLTGRTAESGFYRGRDEVFDFAAGDYRPRERYEAPRDARELLTAESPEGRYAKDVLLTTLAYCCDTAPEICDAVDAIDSAMELGYGWKKGPFALADSLGVEWVAGLYEGEAPSLLQAAVRAGGFYGADTVLGSDGTPQAPRERAGVVTVAELVKDAEKIAGNEAATVYRRADGVALFTFTTPMNACSVEALAVMREVAQRTDVRALVIASDNPTAFCAGADLPTIARLAATGEAEAAYEVVRAGAESLQALRDAPFPVVGAVRGVALGGGLELLLHTDASVIHAETRVGFPERSVGLYPGWGGTVRVLERLVDLGVENPHERAFSALLNVKPLPAVNFPLLREADRVILSPDHVIAEAVELAGELAEGYAPPAARELPLYPGELSFTEGSETDRAIGDALAREYAGEGTISAHELGLRESKEASAVLVRPKNAERAMHMAKTRKPLNN